MTPREQKKLLDSIDVDWSSLIPEIQPILEADFADAAKAFLLRADIPETSDPGMWTKVLDEARTYARTRSAELVGMRVTKDGRIVPNPNAAWSITDTTRDKLRLIGDATIEHGLTVNETQRLIMDNEAFSPARALNISRTERAFARGRGTHIAAKAAGMKKKNWELGENPCEICEANADQGWIPIDEPFESGDDCIPGHPSCRCTNGYTNEETE